MAALSSFIRFVLCSFFSNSHKARTPAAESAATSINLYAFAAPIVAL